MLKINSRYLNYSSTILNSLFDFNGKTNYDWQNKTKSSSKHKFDVAQEQFDRIIGIK